MGCERIHHANQELFQLLLYRGARNAQMGDRADSAGRPLQQTRHHNESGCNNSLPRHHRPRGRAPDQQGRLFRRHPTMGAYRHRRTAWPI